jgi:hypothetical protein
MPALATESSIKYAQLLDKFQETGKLLDIKPIMADSGGTHLLLQQPSGQVSPYYVTDLPLSISATLISGALPFSQVGPGVAPGGGNYEIPASSSFIGGAYLFRKNSTTTRTALSYQTSPIEEIFLGSIGVPFSVLGSTVYNNSAVWQDFVLGLLANNGSGVAAGKIGYNGTSFCYQAGLPNASGTQLYKSFCSLWETGFVTPTGGAPQVIPVTFANPMKDAAYFVVTENEDYQAGSSLIICIDSKTATGFNIDISGVPVAEEIFWFAVRYGV